MEYVNIPGTSLSPSRIGLGTWAIGGWMWSDTDEERSEDPGSASVRNFQGDRAVTSVVFGNPARAHDPTAAAGERDR